MTSSPPAATTPSPAAPLYPALQKQLRALLGPERDWLANTSSSSTSRSTAMRALLLFFCFFFLLSIPSLLQAQSTPQTIFRLCPSDQVCPPKKGLSWAPQRVLGWRLQIPSGKLYLGQPLLLEVAPGVTLSTPSGKVPPKEPCSRNGWSCYRLRLGEPLVVEGAAKKGTLLRRLWLVGPGKALPPSPELTRSLQRRYGTYRWSSQPTWRSSPPTSPHPAPTPRKASRRSPSRARPLPPRSPSEGASSFTAKLVEDLREIALKKARTRAWKMIKKRLCQKVCFCQQKNKKPRLPRSCRLLASQPLQQTLRHPEKLRRLLRADLLDILQKRLAAAPSDRPPLVQSLLGHSFDLLRGYLLDGDSYRTRQLLQNKMRLLLQLAEKHLQQSPTIALLFRLTVARLGQCAASPKPCTLHLNRLFRAQKGYPLAQQKLLRQLTQRWQHLAQLFQKRYHSALHSLQKLEVRCQRKEQGKLTLSFPNGSIHIVHCKNLPAKSLLFLQQLRQNLPLFQTFLQHQPAYLVFQQMHRENQQFLKEILRLLQRIRGARASLAQGSPARRWLAEQTAEVQWLLSTLHKILLHPTLPLKKRARLFFSLVTHLLQHSLVERQKLLQARLQAVSQQAKEKLLARLKKLKQARESLRQMQQIWRHLVQGNLGRVVEIMAKALLQTKGSALQVSALQVSAQQRRAFQFLVMLVSYADALSDPSPAGDARRKELLQSLFQEATERRKRIGEWLIGAEIGVGFTSGYQWLAKNLQDNYNGEFAPPQLSLPMGVSFQYWPQPNVGFSLFLFALDLGQFTNYEFQGRLGRDSFKVNKPTIGSLLALGLQISLAFGSPESAFFLGAEARLAPTLFEDEKSEKRGALRFGLFLGTNFLLWEFL